MLFAGDYDLRFSYKTNSGLESALSNNITFSVAPDAFTLYQNYPNPFNPTTTIKYSIPERTRITLKIFNVLGQVIETIVNEEKIPGNYTIIYDASLLSSGIYFYQLNAGHFSETRKFLLIK